MNEVPHSQQNFALSRFSHPQLGQRMTTTSFIFRLREGFWACILDSVEDTVGSL